MLQLRRDGATRTLQVTPGGCAPDDAQPVSRRCAGGIPRTPEASDAPAASPHSWVDHPAEAPSRLRPPLAAVAAFGFLSLIRHGSCGAFVPVGDTATMAPRVLASSRRPRAVRATRTMTPRSAQAL